MSAEEELGLQNSIYFLASEILENESIPESVAKILFAKACQSIYRDRLPSNPEEEITKKALELVETEIDLEKIRLYTKIECQKFFLGMNGAQRTK